MGKGEFWPRWRCRYKPFTSLHNQKRVTTNLKSINNQKCQKNQTAWNSDNQRIKETVNQQPDENLRWDSGLWGQDWLNGKLRLRADCELWRLPWWEKFPVSHESLLESGARDKQASCTLPSLAPPPQVVLLHSKEGCPALVNTQGPAPLQLNRCAKTKKYDPNERTEQNFRKRAKQWGDSLSDGEFKALVIKMLTELIELDWKMKEQMKDTQIEIKQNIQGNNSTRRKPGLKSMIWNKRKK